MHKIGIKTGAGIIVAAIAVLLSLWIPTFGAQSAYAEEGQAPTVEFSQESELIYGNVYVLDGIVYLTEDNKLTGTYREEGEVTNVETFLFQEITPDLDPETELISIPRLSAGDHEIFAVLPTAESDFLDLRPVTLHVAQRPIEIAFTGSVDVPYSGAATEREKTIDGLLEGDDLGLTVLYNGEPAPKNVGEYEITLRIENPNYCEGEEIAGGRQLRITPRTLVITLRSATVNCGDDIEFTFTYGGFVPGEDESVLFTLPTASIDTSRPGVYSVMPTGASADNYTIRNVPGTITVNNVFLDADPGEGLHASVSGVFAPGATLEIARGDVNGNDYKVMTERVKGLFNHTNPDAYYRVRVLNNTNSNGFKLTIYNQDFSVFAGIHILVMDEDGNLYRVQKSSMRDGALTFDCPVSGEILIYEDFTVLGIVLAVIIFLILFIVAFKIVENYRYRKARKDPPYRKERPRYDW